MQARHITISISHFFKRHLHHYKGGKGSTHVLTNHICLTRASRRRNSCCRTSRVD
jgi:hypothetical protein